MVQGLWVLFFQVEFGNMHEYLVPNARYRYRKTSSHPWQLLGYEDAARLRLTCRKGLLETLAVTCKLAWIEPDPSSSSDAAVAID